MTTDSLQKEERILPFLRLFRIGQKVECSQMERNPNFLTFRFILSHYLELSKIRIIYYADYKYDR